MQSLVLLIAQVIIYLDIWGFWRFLIKNFWCVSIIDLENILLEDLCLICLLFKPLFGFNCNIFVFPVHNHQKFNIGTCRQALFKAKNKVEIFFYFFTIPHTIKSLPLIDLPLNSSKEIYLSFENIFVIRSQIYSEINYY